MSRSESLKRAQAKYEKKYRERGLTKSYQLKCHIEHDADIIEVLDGQENKNGYIKDLIRSDIESKKQG